MGAVEQMGLPGLCGFSLFSVNLGAVNIGDERQKKGPTLRIWYFCTLAEASNHRALTRKDEDVRVSVIDFEDATEHECEQDLPIKMYTYPPNKYEFGCEELYNICMGFHVWTPRE